jgi:hypothetical protein
MQARNGPILAPREPRRVLPRCRASPHHRATMDGSVASPRCLYTNTCSNQRCHLRPQTTVAPREGMGRRDAPPHPPIYDRRVPSPLR